jgi:DNA (cytosine-5)-methyltransferase 1
MPKLGQYLQIKEAAACLGVCLNMLRNWEVTGKLPVHRHPLNNYRLFKISDLDALIREAERSAGSHRKPR